MVTYMNEHCKRVPVEDADAIKIYYTIDALLNELSDEAFHEAVEIISDHVWDGGRANANRVRALAKRLGVEWRDLEIWYCLED